MHHPPEGFDARSRAPREAPPNRPLPPLLLPLLLVPLWVAGCGAEEGEPPPETAGLDESAETSPAEVFWASLEEHCGNAYAGGLTREPPGDEMLTGTEELLVHFRECREDELRLPFHIELEEEGDWDRSRTWVFLRHPDGLELRHDHRNPDGTEEENTWYGGFTTREGTAIRQDFLSEARTEESGYERGWRVEIVPHQRYTYGTTRRGEWSWRVDFDLTEPVAGPPPPWGHE